MTKPKTKAVDQVLTEKYAIYQGDCIDIVRGLPDNSVDYSISSPPFVGLYRFSAFDRDISNSDDVQFWEHMGFLIKELLRVVKPGRLCTMHCMNLPRNKGRDGFIGMYDFRGDLIRAFESQGWYHHSETTIWKDPVVAQQRTKSLRLLHKQIVKDSSMSGQGLADYIVTFRKPGDNETPIEGELTEWIGDDTLDVSREAYELQLRGASEYAWSYEKWKSILIWQRLASPVWTDIRQGRTLQFRAGRHEHDIAHISPLQLDVIERCIQLWTLPGEVVFTPFLGIGSEVYAAVEMGRFGIGAELKESYFAQAVRNIARIGTEAVETALDEEA